MRLNKEAFERANVLGWTDAIRAFNDEADAIGQCRAAIGVFV